MKATRRATCRQQDSQEEEDLRFRNRTDKEGKGKHVGGHPFPFQKGLKGWGGCSEKNYLREAEKNKKIGGVLREGEEV